MKGTPKPKPDYKIPDPDTYIVWLDSLADVGTQTTTGKFGTKEQRKLRLTWELCGTRTSPDDPRPLTISQEYTWDMSEKSNLYKIVKPWIGKTPDRNYDLDDLFNHPAQVSIIHNQVGEKTYANVSTIMPLPKGSTPPARVNAPFVFDMEDRRTTMADFLKLPEWLRNKILKSPEGARFAAESDGTPEIAEDIPF